MPFEQLKMGQTDSEGEWGTFKIAETLEIPGVAGTFPWTFMRTFSGAGNECLTFVE